MSIMYLFILTKKLILYHFIPLEIKRSSLPNIIYMGTKILEVGLYEFIAIND